MQQPPPLQIAPGGFSSGAAPHVSGISGDYVPGESKTLWMGTVQPGWDETFITGLFPSHNGEAITVKVMRHPATNMPLGYAFVDFASHDAALNALNSLNGQTIPGTNVTFRLNWGAGGRKPSTFSTQQEFSLFVGDLGPEVTDGMLQEAFASKYPSCSSAKVVTESATGISKGYGFVRFTDKAQCDDALQTMNGTVVGSRSVRVSPATARRQDRHMMGSPHHMNGTLPLYPMRGGMPHGMSSPWGSPRSTQSDVMHQQSLASAIAAAGSLEPTSEGSMPVSETPSTASTLSPQHHAENTTVFVGNLDPSVTEDQLHNHFQGHGNIIQVKIPPNRGCGFVKYDNRESAERALASLHGSILAGLRIRLDWGKANASGRRYSGMAMAVDPSMAGYPLQAQQYYFAQWQAQQAQAAYYYGRYGGQGPVYVLPQQGYPATAVGRQQGNYIAGAVQYPQSPLLSGAMVIDGSLASGDYSPNGQSLMGQPSLSGLSWSETAQ